MKGILHKAEQGWTVWYTAKEDLYYGNTGLRIVPLDPESIGAIFIQDTDHLCEGKEVEFELIKYPNPPHNPTYHGIDVAARLLPSPGPTSLLNSIRANPSWDEIIKEFHLATQQVPIGAPPLIFECWLVENYQPPKKK